jgi:hypothetical protein
VTPSRPSSPWAPCLVPRPISTSRAFHRRRDNIIKHFQHSYQRASAFIIQHCMSRGIMVFRVQLFMVRATLAYPPPSTALDLDCERDDPSSADVDHCFWFLGHLCIFWLSLHFTLYPPYLCASTSEGSIWVAQSAIERYDQRLGVLYISSHKTHSTQKK